MIPRKSFAFNNNFNLVSRNEITMMSKLFSAQQSSNKLSANNCSSKF